MSASGHKQTLECEWLASAFGLRADLRTSVYSPPGLFAHQLDHSLEKGLPNSLPFEIPSVEHLVRSNCGVNGASTPCWSISSFAACHTSRSTIKTPPSQCTPVPRCAIY